MLCTHSLAPGDIYASWVAAAFLALVPRSFFSGTDLAGRCEWRMAEARWTAVSRRSARYPFLATWLATAL